MSFFPLRYDGDGLPGVTTFKQQGALCGRTYQAKVSAMNRAGEGLHSEIATASLALPPSAPEGLMVTGSKSDRIDLAWDPPSQPGCALIKTYRVERDGGAGFVAIGEVNMLQQTYSDSTITPGVMYVYRVTAKNELNDNFGLFSDTATVVAAEVPAPPTGFYASSWTGTSITLKWTAPASDGGWGGLNWGLCPELSVPQ